MVYPGKRAKAQSQLPVGFTFILWGLFIFAGITGCKTTNILSAKKAGSTGGTDTVTSFQLMVSSKYIDASKEKILGNFGEAERLLKECLAADPNHHPSYYQLADIGYITGRYDDALEWIGKAISLDETNVWYKVLYADILLKLGRYKEAVPVYREIIALQPEQRLWIEGLAYTQHLAGDARGAAKSYQRILSRYGFDESIFFKMTAIYEKQGNEKKMEQSLQWLVKEFPYESHYLGFLATFYNEHNQPEKALPLWNEILRLEPGNGEVRFELANYYRDRGEDEKAFRELYRAFSTPNLSIDAKIVVMLSYYNLTEKYPQMLPEAYQLLDLMVTNHPENPKGWSMYADFLYRDKKYREAWQKLKTVVALDSSRYMVWEQLLNCAYILNDFTSLKDDGARAIGVFPDQSLLYFYHGTGLIYSNEPVSALNILNTGYYFTGFMDSLATAYLHAIARSYEIVHDTLKAREFYAKAASKNFVGSSLLADYARFLAENRDKENIRGLSETIGKFGVKDPLLDIAELWVLVSLDEKVDISGRLEQIVSSNHDDYRVLEQAGSLYLYSGNRNMSRAVWKDALKLSTGNHLLTYMTENL